MKPASKEEWAHYLAGLEKLLVQRLAELKERIDEGRDDRRIEQASVAVIDCEQRIKMAKTALAQYE